MKTYFVYMVFCTDGTYYVGMTNNLERRIGEHNYGIDPNCYTYSRRPVVLKYSQDFAFVWDAIDAEKKDQTLDTRKEERSRSRRLEDDLAVGKSAPP